MTISKAEARGRGLEQATEWRPRNEVMKNPEGSIDYLEYCCREAARLGNNGVDADVVHADDVRSKLVCLFREAIPRVPLPWERENAANTVHRGAT